jgi:hypothetical protein
MAPSSSHSTGEETVPPDPEPENSLVEKLPTARRRSTQPGEFALPDSGPSYLSSTFVAEGDKILEMIVEHIMEEEEDHNLPPTARL